MFVSTVFQEPPKEDLTVSEKFQLVLDVAQKAQVRGGRQSEGHSRLTSAQISHLICLSFCFVLTESVWEDVEHPGENKEVSLST